MWIGGDVSAAVGVSEASTDFVKHLGKRSLLEIWSTAPFMELGYCFAAFHLIWCIIRCYLHKRSFMSREAVLSRLIWLFPTHINAFPSTSPTTWDVNYFKYCHFIQHWRSFVAACAETWGPCSSKLHTAALLYSSQVQVRLEQEIYCRQRFISISHQHWENTHLKNWVLETSVLNFVDWQRGEKGRQDMKIQQ